MAKIPLLFVVSRQLLLRCSTSCIPAVVVNSQLLPAIHASSRKILSHFSFATWVTLRSHTDKSNLSLIIFATAAALKFVLLIFKWFVPLNSFAAEFKT